MALDDDNAAEAIAAEWGVDVDLFNELHWVVDTIDGNDGELYGYVIRFDDDSDPAILSQLGLREGEFSRRLSLNAFDEPDYSDEDYDRDLRMREGTEDAQPIDVEDDDGTFPIDEPLPDLPPGDAYLLDDKGSYLTDEKGRPLIATGQASSGALGGAPSNEYETDGPAYAGRSFAGHAFATGAVSSHGNSVEALRFEMLARLDSLDAIIRSSLASAPNRGHNHPPELIEIERPVPHKQLREVVVAIKELRRESESSTPDTINVDAQISVFQRVARLIAISPLWLGGAAVTGIVGQEAATAYTAHKQQMFDALVTAVDAVSMWVQHIPSIL